MMHFSKGFIRYRLEGIEYRENFDFPGETAMNGLTVKACSDDGSPEGRRLMVLLKPQKEIDICEFHVSGAVDLNADDVIFLNGFQSWTDSREFSPDETMDPLFKGLRLVKVNRLGDYDFYDYSGIQGKLHGYTYTYIKDKSGKAVLAGSLSEREGYTVFEYNTREKNMCISMDLAGRVISEEKKVMDVWLAEGSEKEAFESYWKQMELPLSNNPPLTGWTSWYYHYTDICERVIIENLEAFKALKLPIDVFQIDDGYQKAVGDWLDIKDSFPNGMKAVADRIKAAGIKPGLWLAPFVCDKRSRLFRDHRDWIAYDDEGRLQTAGWNPQWTGTYYALDIYNPEVREYIRNVFHTVLDEWGYELVKLDFLYAAAMAPNRGLSRGGMMADAVDFLRECTGDRLILGCGVPLGSAFGRFEYCRIGSDVALKWEDKLLRWGRYRERISTINSLVSTIGRRRLNNRAFINDPDVFILRDSNNKLSQDDKYSLFLLNNIFGGLVFTSDNPSEYSHDQLELYRSMFPLRTKDILAVKENDYTYEIRFQIGDLEYLVFSNLSDAAKSFNLREGYYYSNDGGEKDNKYIYGGGDITLRPHQSRCFLVVGERGPVLAGGKGHLFPGSDFYLETIGNNQFNLIRDSKAPAGKAVYLRVPVKGPYTVNGTEYEAETVFEDFFIVRTD